MLRARKNRRRFHSEVAASDVSRLSAAGCQTLEHRQLLTGIVVAPDAATEDMAAELQQMDNMFARMGSDPAFVNDHDSSGDGLVVSNIGSSGADGVFLHHGQMQAATAAVDSELPLPLVIPAGLGGDMTTGEAHAVAQASQLYDSIAKLQGEKTRCMELVAELEQEVAGLKDVLDNAQQEQQARQAASDQARKDADAADAKQDDLKGQLQQLKSDLKSAVRARNEYARAISAAARLSRQAQRRGNQAEADGFARQVQPNYEAYQQKVAEIKAIKNQMKAIKQQINAARGQEKKAKTAAQTANKALTAAKQKTAEAQQKYDDAVQRLEEARRKCDQHCQALQHQRGEYLGTEGQEGAHAAAASAIQNAKQRKQARLDAEAADREQQAADAAAAAEAARLRAHNQVKRQDLELPAGLDKDDVTPCDITRLIAQQSGDSVPDNATGNQLAAAAAVKAFQAKAAEDGVRSIANVLFGAAFDQLAGIIPVLGQLKSLAETVEGFKEFAEDFVNGNLKFQRDVWTPDWGIVVTTTVYNPNTCTYIATTQVLFYDPSTYSQHAGGAGRDGITVAPGQAGLYTVTHFGTVRSK